MWVNILLAAIGIFLFSCDYLGYHIIIESEDPMMDKVEDYIEDKTGVKIDITYSPKINLNETK